MARLVVEWRYRYLPYGVRCWVTRDSYTLLWSTKSGYTYRGCHLPFMRSGAADQHAEVFDTIWSRAIKRKPANGGSSYSSHGRDSWLEEAFPSVHEFATAGVFEDTQERRDHPTFTFWVKGGTWNVSVKDKAEGQVLWLTAQSLLELMQMMELFVLDPTAPWKHDDYQHPRDGKRVNRK